MQCLISQSESWNTISFIDNDSFGLLLKWDISGDWLSKYICDDHNDGR